MGKIVNSAAGNDFFTIAGVAINDDSQPEINGGTIAGIGTTEITRPGFNGYEPVIVNMIDIEYSGDFKMAGVDFSASNEHTNTSDLNRRKIRTVKTATAIRNDQWVPYSGIFSPAPSAADDTTSTLLLSDNGNTAESKTRVTHALGVSVINTEL